MQRMRGIVATDFQYISIINFSLELLRWNVLFGSPIATLTLGVPEVRCS